jgi:hypothetical protein
LHSGVTFYVRRLNENNESIIKTYKKLHNCSNSVSNLQTQPLQYTASSKTFALHSAVMGYSLANQKRLFGNTLLPAQDFIPAFLTARRSCAAA